MCRGFEIEEFSWLSHDQKMVQNILFFSLFLLEKIIIFSILYYYILLFLYFLLEKR